MADIDLSAQFATISDKAKTATDKLKAAAQSTNDQLEADAEKARDRANAAAERLKDNADRARDTASSQWHEMRDKWQSHVAKVRAAAKQKKHELDAHEAATDADLAEDYALDTIDFVQAAIEEAEYACLDAMYARARADALNS